MKRIQILLLALLGLGAFSSLAAQDFQKDFATAKKLSQETGKPIVILFSGSDWCRPCMRLHQQVYEDATFQEYADDHVILYKADFPRRPENQLPAEVKAVNESLAKEHGVTGLPTTVVVSSKGKVKGKLVGNPSNNREGYMDYLQGVVKN